VLFHTARQLVNPASTVQWKPWVYRKLFAILLDFIEGYYDEEGIVLFAVT
jgi:hypothetical protein